MKGGGQVYDYGQLTSGPPAAGGGFGGFGTFNFGGGGACGSGGPGNGARSPVLEQTGTTWGGCGLGLGFNQDLSQDPMFWGVASRWADDEKGLAAGKGGKNGPESQFRNVPANIRAAAAAAIEQPANSGASRNSRREPPRDDYDYGAMIQKAQAEAERRRIGSRVPNAPNAPMDIQTAQSQAANRRCIGQEEAIRNAQMRNIPMAQADAMVKPKWSNGSPLGPPRQSGGPPLRAEELLGKWIDMRGNSVNVYNADAYELRLMASVSRYPREDLQLAIRQLPDQGWHCGNASLDNSISTLEQLHWISPNGNHSVWLRGRE